MTEGQPLTAIVGRPTTPPRVRGFSLPESRGFEALSSAGAMGSLAILTLRLAVRPPFTWYRGAIESAAFAFRGCIVPLTISMFVFFISFGYIVLGRTVALIGAEDRVAGGFWIASVREVTVWVTTMIFAGIAGSAVTANLGARKVREELDALAVLGVDEVRTLVVPNVMAFTFAAPLLGMVALLVSQVTNLVVTVGMLGVPFGTFADNIANSIYPIDLIAALIKYIVIGYFVGIVSCHKGRTCKPGAGGVGIAVNQAVVISFFGIWLFNNLYSLAFLILFPAVSIPVG